MPLIDIDAKNRDSEQQNADTQPVAQGLIACPECGHQISRRALTCPNCADVLRSVERDPILMIVFLVIAAGLFIAGLWTMYAPTTLLGGDAYNYIVAAGRGVGLVGVGVGVVVFAFGIHFSQAVQTRPVSRHSVDSSSTSDA